MSTITDEVRAEVAQGRCARLRRCIPLCLDALRLQIRDEGRVKNKAVDSWVGASSRWMQVFNEAPSGLSRYLDGRRRWIASVTNATQPSIQTPKFRPAVSTCDRVH